MEPLERVRQFRVVCVRFGPVRVLQRPADLVRYDAALPHPDARMPRD
jgi:hypothetical protein